MMTGISKSFPGVKALESVALAVARGEVLGLVGENGAGKSTLMKILAGIDRPDSGTIQIQGQKVDFHSPRDAARHGIALIHQELALLDNLDVAANIFLGREPTWGGRARLIDTKRIRSEAQQVLDRLGVPFSARTAVSELSLAHKQMVEIARALSLNAQILLMDEPTSSLTAAETERLLEIVAELRAQGVSIIYISHRLREVEKVAERVTVLRDGKNSGNLQGSEITHSDMVRLMVGRDLQPHRHVTTSAPKRDRFFELKGIRTSCYPNREVSLTIHPGEILGIAGLVGAGRSELARAIFGADQMLSGKLLVGGQPLKIESPRDAIAAGIYLIPEDRRTLGLITEMTVRENVSLPALRRYSSAMRLIRNALEKSSVVKACAAMSVKTPSIETRAASLSGGNQQKVVLAKWLTLSPKLILFDEPTRGIDVAAKAEIHECMRRLADEGVAILMISSDMDEILGNSDRVAVMREGDITAILDRAECSEEAIMRLAVA